MTGPPVTPLASITSGSVRVYFGESALAYSQGIHDGAAAERERMAVQSDPEPRAAARKGDRVA